MTTLVVDAGVLAIALVDDGELGHRTRARLLGSALAAPELIDLEVASVIRKHVLAGNLRRDRGHQAIDDLASLPLTRLPHRPLLSRIWQLHHGMTSYDAAYVASAEVLRVPLVTTDSRLTRAPGARCAVEVVS